MVNLGLLFCTFSRYQISKVYFPTSPKLSCKHCLFHTLGLIFFFGPVEKPNTSLLLATGNSNRNEGKWETQTSQQPL